MAAPSFWGGGPQFISTAKNDAHLRIQIDDDDDDEDDSEVETIA